MPGDATSWASPSSFLGNQSQPLAGNHLSVSAFQQRGFRGHHSGRSLSAAGCGARFAWVKPPKRLAASKRGPPLAKRLPSTLEGPQGMFRRQKGCGGRDWEAEGGRERARVPQRQRTAPSLSLPPSLLPHLLTPLSPQCPLLYAFISPPLPLASPFPSSSSLSPRLSTPTLRPSSPNPSKPEAARAPPGPALGRSRKGVCGRRAARTGHRGSGRLLEGLPGRHVPTWSPRRAVLICSRLC